MLVEAASGLEVVSEVAVMTVVVDRERHIALADEKSVAVVVAGPGVNSQANSPAHPHPRPHHSSELSSHLSPLPFYFSCLLYPYPYPHPCPARGRDCRRDSAHRQRHRRPYHPHRPSDFLCRVPRPSPLDSAAAAVQRSRRPVRILAVSHVILLRPY